MRKGRGPLWKQIVGPSRIFRTFEGSSERRDSSFASTRRFLLRNPTLRLGSQLTGLATSRSSRRIRFERYMEPRFWNLYFGIRVLIVIFLGYGHGSFFSLVRDASTCRRYGALARRPFRRAKNFFLSFLFFFLARLRALSLSLVLSFFSMKMQHLATRNGGSRTPDISTVGMEGL